jgi:hypothetical protein
MFYAPMALFIPPSIFAVHVQFNLLYQFWIHTNVKLTMNAIWVLEFDDCLLAGSGETGSLRVDPQHGQSPQGSSWEKPILH